VANLKPLHVTRWVDKHWPVKAITKAGKTITPAASDNTREGAIRAVKRGFNWAEKQGVLSKNPVKAVQKPKATPRDVYLWPEQYDQLLILIKDQCFRDVVEVLRHTGCRPQELRLVEARWFNREDRCWEFPKKGVPQKLRGRVVMLDDTAFEICQRIALKYPEGPMFRNRRGQPWKKDALVCRCRRLRPKVGFYVCPYAIRHTFATDAILRDVDLVSIAKLMGHADLRMLSTIYEHVEKRTDHLRKELNQAVGHLKAVG
jgi:integrase